MMGMSEGTSARASASLGLGLALCSISGVMSALVMVPIMPDLFRVFEAVPNATFWLPALMTIPGLCAALLSPLFGYLGDRIDSKWPLIACLILYVLFGLMPFFISSLPLLTVTRIGLGIAQTGVLVISMAMIAHLFDHAARERWLAVQAAAATGSSILLLPLSGLLAERLGWQGAFLLFLLGLGLALFIVLQQVPRRAASDHAAAGDTHIPWAWLLGQCAVTSIGGIIFFATQFQLGLALAAVGVTGAATIGALSAFAAGGVVIGTLIFMPAKRRLGRMLLPLVLVMSGIALIVIWTMQTLPVLLICAFASMIANGMMLPTLVTQVAAGLPDAVRGRGMGIWNSAFVLAQFLSSAFLGAVLSRPGWTVLDAFGLLGCVSIALAAILTLRARPSTD